MSTPRSLVLPDGVRPRTIATARGEFAALVAEPADDRPVALLVPGWTGSKEDYAEVLAPVARAGYRAVSVDQRGQFETPGSHDATYALDEFGADLLSLIAAYGGRAHLVGHSFGGLVARSAAIADPSAVASVTLLCSGPSALPQDVHPLLNALADAISSAGLAVAWQAKRAHDLANGAPVVTPEIEAFLERRFLANDPISLQAITRLLTSAPDRVDELRATGVPVQVAFGAVDDGWPIDTQRDMAVRLGAAVHVIEDAGHSPAVERPDATATTLLNFWRMTT